MFKRLPALSKTGFTIVELLIVIVVIGILAAVTVVAYATVSDRATISSINANLAQVNKAIRSYHSTNGSYPSTGGTWVAQSDATKNSFVPGLVPDIIGSIPRAVQWDGSSTYYYRSDGNEYKFLFLYPSTQTIPSSASSDPSIQAILDPNRPTRGWGYWTPGGSNF
jgi:prepilin-type N-terminal cleavage/methylation domain-containing protein